MAETRIIYGFHAVTSRLRQSPQSVKEVYLDAARDDRRSQEFVKTVEAAGARVMRVDEKRLDGLTHHARHQGVAARIEVARLPTHIEDVLDALDEPALLLILDGVTDPHNLGACLRVADAMGVHAVIAPKDRAVGINATVSKVASGARGNGALYRGHQSRARAARSERARHLDRRRGRARRAGPLCGEAHGPLAWVLGAEGEGMRRLTREHCDELVRIPMLGTVESLNVSVSAGICLAETRRQRRATRSWHFEKHLLIDDCAARSIARNRRIASVNPEPHVR